MKLRDIVHADHAENFPTLEKFSARGQFGRRKNGRQIQNIYGVGFLDQRQELRLFSING